MQAMYLVAEGLHHLRSVNDWAIAGAAKPDRLKEALADTPLRRASQAVKGI